MFFATQTFTPKPERRIGRKTQLRGDLFLFDTFPKSLFRHLQSDLIDEVSDGTTGTGTVLMRQMGTAVSEKFFQYGHAAVPAVPAADIALQRVDQLIGFPFTLAQEYGGLLQDQPNECQKLLVGCCRRTEKIFPKATE